MRENLKKILDELGYKEHVKEVKNIFGIDHYEVVDNEEFIEEIKKIK